MLYVHPPLATAAYVFIFLFAAFQLLNNRSKRLTLYVGLAGWVLTFSGLVSGMIWAQIGWGTYWSWDPKEDATLLLFVVVSFSVLTFFEENKYSKAAAVIAGIFSVLTILVSFIALGTLHLSFEQKDKQVLQILLKTFHTFYRKFLCAKTLVYKWIMRNCYEVC